jgi:hypothetical protein
MNVPDVTFDSSIMAVDWNEDGDIDLLNVAGGNGYLLWYDHSFLRHGYAPARVEKLEARPSAGKKAK